MPDSSPETEIEVKPPEATAEAAADAKDNSAESSPAEKDGQQKGDVLSAVKAALKPEKESSPDSANQDPEKDAAAPAEKEGGAGEDDSEDFSEEEKARLSQKAKRRFHKLAGEVTDLTKKIGDLEPQAQQFQKIVNFVQDAGLSADEMNRTFDVAKAIKQDPLRAYEMLKPVFEQLQQLVGEVIPADLQQAVNLGQITEAHARELARSRSAATLREQQLQRFEQRNTVERQHNAVKSQWDAAANATTAWENSKAKSDPEWKLKQPRVIQLIELNLLKQRQANPNYVPSVEDAVSIANQALETVNNEFKALRPKPKAVNPITDVASTRSEAKPKTALEAARRALAAAG